MAIEKCNEAIVHNSNCSLKECTLISCRKVEKLFHHKNICQRVAGCGICKQFLALISFHSKNCHIQNCSVKYCREFKELRTRYSLGRKSNFHFLTLKFSFRRTESIRNLKINLKIEANQVFRFWAVSVGFIANFNTTTSTTHMYSIVSLTSKDQCFGKIRI